MSYTRSRLIFHFLAVIRMNLSFSQKSEGIRNILETLYILIDPCAVEQFLWQSLSSVLWNRDHSSWSFCSEFPPVRLQYLQESYRHSKQCIIRRWKTGAWSSVACNSREWESCAMVEKSNLTISLRSDRVVATFWSSEESHCSFHWKSYRYDRFELNLHSFVSRILQDWWKWFQLYMKPKLLIEWWRLILTPRTFCQLDALALPWSGSAACFWRRLLKAR
jgi:hypothetical protein